jgi:DNA processing protein
LNNKELKQRLQDTLTLLSVPGVGRSRYWKLVKEFGTAADALAAPADRLEEISGLGRAVASAIKAEADAERAAVTAGRIIQQGWEILFPGDDGYPPQLSEIPDRPPILFAAGLRLSPDDRMIAIVGTRHATERGRLFAARLAGALAESGITVVSGMAEGIDTAAHIGALEAGGRTVAVWGTSLDIVYPSGNRQLAERIKGQGAVLSEYCPGQGPDKGTFPERNRIISGLADGVVVVEAGVKSGALITAELALQQGRELFAVPGPPAADRSAGTNRLIKNGARLVTSVDDIFEELPRLKGAVKARSFKARPEMTATEQRVIEMLADGPLQIDQLAAAADIPVSELMEFLLALEMKGVVQEISGKRFVLCD